MKANAAVKEIDTEKYWEENKIYEKNLAQRNKQDKFILHDGPPYLSSDKIHIGTALNKILKDIVVKYKSQTGYYSPYVPGYDGHGLPIENAAVKSIKGGKDALTPTELRQKSREFALGNLKGQEINFKRLGVWGNWENPYITINPEFEAHQVKVFGEINKKDYIYKGLKPVYWCANCETALAEAEVEYADHKSYSIYVKFKFDEVNAQKAYNLAGLNINNPLSMVIWTTTPWTLPANLAIAVHPEFKYVFVQRNREEDVYIIAKDLLESTVKNLGWAENSYNILKIVKGETLEFLKAEHPFIDRESLVILGEHVTTEAGTGCVHTAPGHGLEDYEAGNKYKLGIISPLTGKGIFTDEAGKFSGMRYNKANEEIIK
ncbi:MAG: class I tRNA ligase family protein, partial [Candidatus Aenigmarchaeota archaeon]|nr:class I tRNA ligase family protein [Candidatus Aenigmarchaeota archaeon]